MVREPLVKSSSLSRLSTTVSHTVWATPKEVTSVRLEEAHWDAFTHWDAFFPFVAEDDFFLHFSGAEESSEEQDSTDMSSSSSSSSESLELSE